jgi:predicted nucleic acid-binding protein
MKGKIFVDADIALDLLLERQPHYEHAAQLFSRAERGEVKLYTSSLIICNIYYLLAKNLRKDIARKILSQFRLLVGVLPVDEKAIDQALVSDFSDVEDAVQYFTAKYHSIDILITRNLKDYKAATIRVVTAQTFLKG